MNLTTSSPLEALEALRILVGSENILTKEEARESYEHTTFDAPYTVLGVIICRTSALIPDIVNIANKYKTPLYPISGGKNWGYGNALPPKEALVVDLSLLKNISHFDADLGTVTLEPGVTQQDLYDFLKQQKIHYLVPVHGGGPTCSIVGNALERGYGITPHMDHFSAVMSLTAVLPNGEQYTSLLNSLGGVAASHVYKWGTGPYLDGLFSQGNFGIVTSMTIALVKKPKSIKLVYFRIKKTTDLDYLIPALRETLRIAGGATGSFNIMNTHRVLSMTQPYPGHHSAKNPILSKKEINALATAGHITAWTGIGSLYGDAHMVRAAQKILKRELGGEVTRLFFIPEWLTTLLLSITKRAPRFLVGKINTTLLSLSNLFRILHGEPNEVALPLAYWKSDVPIYSHPLNPSKDGCGLYWYSPLIPFKEKSVQEYLSMVYRVCKKHGIEPLITLTTLSERCFDSTVPILFNKKDTDEATRAKACYYELFTEGQKLGYVPYRYSIESLHLLKDTDSSAVHFASALKKAIDPNNIIAPGRYTFPS